MEKIPAHYLALEEVEEETKIRKYYLEALENGNFRVLPPPVYASGFVKRYAILLGLDEKEMVAEFRALAYGEGEEPAVEEEPMQAVSREREPRKPLPVKNIKNIAAGIVFLIIALWLGSLSRLIYSRLEQKSYNTSRPDRAQQKQALRRIKPIIKLRPGRRLLLSRLRRLRPPTTNPELRWILKPPRAAGLVLRLTAKTTFTAP
jgi:cytoskeletal protein RodZ